MKKLYEEFKLYENMWDEESTQQTPKTSSSTRSLISRSPIEIKLAPVKSTPPISVDDFDESEKVKCAKCGAICINSDKLGIPIELNAWETAFGWRCDKCFAALSDYEASIQSFWLASEDPEYFEGAFGDDDGDIDDEYLDLIAEIIDDWNKAKKDPNCVYSTDPGLMKQMEQRFIKHAKNANIDISPSVFKN